MGEKLAGASEYSTPNPTLHPTTKDLASEKVEARRFGGSVIAGRSYLASVRWVDSGPSPRIQ